MFFLFSLLFACQDYTVAGIEKRQADILVYPDHIDFGHLLSGIESTSQAFIVANTGDEDLNIFAPSLGVIMKKELRFVMRGIWIS